VSVNVSVPAIIAAIQSVLSTSAAVVAATAVGGVHVTYVLQLLMSHVIRNSPTHRWQYCVVNQKLSHWCEDLS